MSEIMRPMSFEQLLNWTMTEYKENGTVFGERHPYHADSRILSQLTTQEAVSSS